jgi:large subunit ribosomal protein L10
MGFVRQVKERMVEELARRYRSYPHFVLVDFRGMKGRDASNLRRDLKAEGVRINVIKNAIARFAFQKIGLSQAVQGLEGMNAVVFGEDPVVIAKKLHEFIDRAKVLAVRGGLIDGRVVTAAEVRAYSKMPGKKELQAALVGTMAAPLSGFVGTLHSVLGTFLRTLKALEEKKGQEPS